MEVAKYIGLFLLKNNTCYIHGLANLELKKTPSVYNGTALTAPTQEILAVPATIVDDTLANFIATNEQISITKASAALKEYSDNTKAAIQAGEEVPVSAIGKFVEVNGKVQFVTHPHFKFAGPAIPFERATPKRPGSEAAHQRPSSVTTTFTQPAYTPPLPQIEEPASDTRINWARILLVVLILGILAAGVIFGMRFIKSGQPAVHIDTLSTQMPVQEETIPIENPLATDDSTEPTDTMVIDESVNAKTPLTTPSVTNPSVVTPTLVKPLLVAPPPAANAKVPITSFKVILNTYDERDKAEKRLQRLRSYGNKVELKVEDSTTFYILMPLTIPVKDKKHVMDSLANNFNPAGVIEY